MNAYLPDHIRDVETLEKLGYLERYTVDASGSRKVGVRLTPKGARYCGDEELAQALERCRCGDHARLHQWDRTCSCGEAS